MLKEQKGRWRTKITSVSVSKEFSEILNKFNISATEVFRMGMGVMLYQFGNSDYTTEINKKRFENAKKILEDFKKMDLIKTQLIEVRDSINKILEIQNASPTNQP